MGNLLGVPHSSASRAMARQSVADSLAAGQRRRGRQWTLAAATAGAAAALFVVPGYVVRHRGVGEAAPEFTAALVSPGPPGIQRTARDFRGQVTLIDFWATYCTNCLPALQELERLHRELGPRGLRVVAVSLDPAGEAGRVRQMTRDLGLTYEVLQDVSGRSRAADQIPGVPTSLLIDRGGVVQHRVLGVLYGGDGVHASEWTTPAGRARLERLLAAR